MNELSEDSKYIIFSFQKFQKLILLEMVRGSILTNSFSSLHICYKLSLSFFFFFLYCLNSNSLTLFFFSLKFLFTLGYWIFDGKLIITRSYKVK